MDSLTILYHAPCFDGLVSAILAREILNEPNATCLPVGYGRKHSWLGGRPVAGPFAVVDFLFHPEAEFWADHHRTTFQTEQSRHQYKELWARNPTAFVFDDTQTSCANLLWTAFQVPAHHETLVKQADQTDSAAYSDPEEALFSKEPHLMLNRGLGIVGADDTERLTEIIDKLQLGGAELAARIPWLRQSTISNDARTRVALQECGEQDQAFKWLASICWDHRRGSVNRYLPWGVQFEAEYSIVWLRNFTMASDKLTVMRNPWLPDGDIHLGDLAGTLGGGGHHRVGSIMLPRTLAEQAVHTIAVVLKKKLER